MFGMMWNLSLIHIFIRVDGVDRAQLRGNGIGAFVSICAFCSHAVFPHADVAMCVHNARHHITAGNVAHLRVFCRELLAKRYDLPVFNRNVPNEFRPSHGQKLPVF